MDIGKSFTFVFEDEEWITKILIAAGILLVGTLFFWVLLIPLIVAYALVAGYSVEITRRVIRGDLQVLPDWDNWGEYLADGLKAFVIVIVYALPAIIVGLCVGVPIGTLSEDGGGLAGVLGFLLSCLNILWAIAMSLLLPAAIAFFAAGDELGAAFRFGEVYAFVRDNIKTYLITFLMSWVANFVGGLGSIVCGVGVLVTTPYGLMVTGHLYGQAYLEASGQAPQPAIEDLDFEEVL
jgi:hypothetical protein